MASVMKMKGSLTHKHLIASFTNAMPKDHAGAMGAGLAFTLLKCRNLFDAFIFEAPVHGQHRQ